MITRRTLTRTMLLLAVGATLPAAEVRFEPVPVLLRETWSDGRVNMIQTWLLEPTPRPYHHECVCGDMTIVVDEVVR